MSVNLIVSLLQYFLHLIEKKAKVKPCLFDLAFDILSNGSLPQLRCGTFCDAERRCNHLAAGSVHTDEMDESWEIFQVCEIKWVKSNA